MTRLSRAVRRTVPTPHRQLVVTLVPGEGGGMLMLRELRARAGYSIMLDALYVQLAARAADQVRAQKRATRLARKAAR